MSRAHHLDPSLAALANFDPVRPIYVPLCRRSVPTRIQLSGFCVEVRTNVPNGFERDGVDGQVRAIAERHGVDSEGPLEVVDGRAYGAGGTSMRYYFRNRIVCIR